MKAITITIKVFFVPTITIKTTSFKVKELELVESLRSHTCHSDEALVLQ